MTMRLADIDAKVIAAWLDKKAKQNPAAAAQAFRSLRAFLTWHAKIEAWMLSEAGIKFVPGQAGLRAVKSGK